MGRRYRNLLALPARASHGLPEIPFSSSNAGGSGDRTSIITVTGNFSPASGALQNIVNGSSSADSSNAFKFTNASSGNEIVFEFLDAEKNLEQIQFFISGAGNLGIWSFFVGDGVSYTQVGATGGVGLSSVTTAFSLDPTRIDFSHFKMTQTGGTTSGTPWVQEIFFFIADAR